MPLIYLAFASARLANNITAPPFAFFALTDICFEFRIIMLRVVAHHATVNAAVRAIPKWPSHVLPRSCKSIVGAW